jgi:exodeoxyribonuclease X
MIESGAAWTTSAYAVVDVEGNGQRPPELVEISIVPIEGGRIGPPKSWLVRPPRPITAMARRFHRIADEDVSGAPRIAEIASDLHAALDGAVFVAHNAGVDLGVLTRELVGFQPVQVVDTLKLARRLLPGRESYKLGALAGSLGLADGLSPDLAPHRATYDAMVCARLLERLATPGDGKTLSLLELLDISASKAAVLPAADESAATLF